jgi:hypothetical protein
MRTNHINTRVNGEWKLYYKLPESTLEQIIKESSSYCFTQILFRTTDNATFNSVRYFIAGDEFEELDRNDYRIISDGRVLIRKKLLDREDC